MLRKLSAELIGTFWLVLGGCGSDIFAAQGIGLLGVYLAFGLTVLRKMPNKIYTRTISKRNKI